MYSGLTSVKRERAKLEVDRVMTESMLADDTLANLLMESDDYFEFTSEDEIESIISKLPETDEEDAQIDKVLSTDENLDVDDLLGVENDVDVEDAMNEIE